MCWNGIGIKPLSIITLQHCDGRQEADAAVGLMLLITDSAQHAKSLITLIGLALTCNRHIDRVADLQRSTLHH